MNMQDKDMDQLFRSKLDSYEVEPSAHVWANINNELGTPQRKSLVPILRVAATVLVLIAAGLFALPKKQDVVSDAPKSNKLQATVIKPDVTVKPSVVQQPVNTAAQVKPAVTAHPKEAIAAVRHTTVQPAVVVIEKPVVDQPAARVDSAPLMASALTPKTTVSTAAMPDGPIAVKPVDITILNTTAPVYALVNTDAETKAPAAKKHKIRGLGGLINAAVGLVDKREDKIIEFTDTDEGDSVTGINLGILKVKKVK